MEKLEQGLNEQGKLHGTQVRLLGSCYLEGLHSSVDL